jgi:AraC-like DNA-binding protein
MGTVLYDPAMGPSHVVTDAPPGVLSLRAWKPPLAGVREVLHARFGGHAYPRHTHDTWTLFIVDDGAIRYDLGRREGAARPSMVSILPPHVVHDGRPGAPQGYTKRVVYLELDVIGEELIGPAADQPILPDVGLRDRVAALHGALACVDDAFEAEIRLNAIAERIRRVLGGRASEPPQTSARQLAECLRADLDDHLFERLTMAQAASAIGVDPTRLARAFADTFGIAPHAYVLGRRIEAARDRILDGQPLADVAAEVGFVDQAHLTRRFTAFLGVTPGRYREAATRQWRLGRSAFSESRPATAAG